MDWGAIRDQYWLQKGQNPDLRRSAYATAAQVEESRARARMFKTWSYNQEKAVQKRWENPENLSQTDVTIAIERAKDRVEGSVWRGFDPYHRQAAPGIRPYEQALKAEFRRITADIAASHAAHWREPQEIDRPDCILIFIQRCERITREGLGGSPTPTLPHGGGSAGGGKA